jgi:hypothetical protein
MRAIRILLVLLACAPAGLGADLRTLEGKTISGDLVRFTEKEVVVKGAEGEVSTPLEQVLTIDLAPAKDLLPRDAKYKDVELTDGTLLHCSQVEVKGKEVKLVTLAEQEIKVPLAAISYVIGDAHDPKVVQTIKERFLGKRRSRDVLIARAADGQLNGLEGTLGAADAKGETIEFELAGSDRKVPLALTRVQGMIFQRPPDATVPICKVIDNYRNAVAASSLSLGPAGLIVTTPCGAKIEYATQLVARLDFSKGKLSFLSDLEPARVVETNNLDRVEHYRRDQSLDGDKIRMDNVKYDKGLSLHAYTELEYKLDGEYQSLQAVIGVDDLVGGSDGPTIVRVEGDGKEIKRWTVTRKDKPMPIKVSIRDVHRLKIIVASGDLLDLGKHVSLADAKVSK